MARRSSDELDRLVDKLVGRRVRLHRKEAKLSLEAVAAALGRSHQQIQKYETGGNRMSVAVLYRIARTLGVPLSAFLDGLPHSGVLSGLEGGRPQTLAAFDLAPDVLDLVDGFARLPPAVRDKIVALVTVMADQD